MSRNLDLYFDENGELKEGILEKNPWLSYLVLTDNVYVNAERIESVGNVSGKETLEYVFRTLDILDELLPDIDSSEESALKEKNALKERENPSAENSESYRKMKFIISEVLKWSEVAKGGRRIQREEWTKKGYPLSIHNLASATIFKDEIQKRERDNHFYKEIFEEGLLECSLKSSSEIVEADKQNEAENMLRLTEVLIKTHGLIGQCIRGETPVYKNAELKEFVGKTDFDLYECLVILNECIIRAVSDEIWKNVEEKTKTLIKRILSGDYSEFSAIYRLENLCPKELMIYKEDADFFEKDIFPKYELWYFTAALSDFEIQQIRIIMTEILKSINASGKNVEHINFKPLSDSLFYDYQGLKHINVYKKRIIEKHIKDASVQNVRLNVKIENGTAFVDYEFSKVCEKLIDFCVEAERSGLLSFEKSIIVLYDMFGFRRDAFDRLNNEEKYLKTMNETANSTKDGIIDYVEGNTVVDVGSGGGVLLDRLEKKYPAKTIIGTDISANVIEVLNQKKLKEGHNWKVLVHNFVEGGFPEKIDNVIFSSILHEIYSYNETEHGCFEIESVKNALRNAYDSLNENGRIIIRDGIKTEGHALRRIRFTDASGLEFFENYVRDFKGLKELTDAEKVANVDRDNLEVSGDINFIREFMYTYTWGIQSYPHEVKEQFGYFTLHEYVEFFENLGAEILLAKEFLEPGYPDHLGKQLALMDESGAEVEFPASNCILVVRKKQQ